VGKTKIPNNLESIIHLLDPMTQRKITNRIFNEPDFYFAIADNITKEFSETMKMKRAKGKNTIFCMWGEGGCGKSFSCMQLMAVTDPTFWANVKTRVFFEEDEAIDRQKGIGRKCNFMLADRAMEHGLGSSYNRDKLHLIIETAREPMNDIGICSVPVFPYPELLHYMLEGLFIFEDHSYWSVTSTQNNSYLGFIGIENPELAHKKEIDWFNELDEQYKAKLRGKVMAGDMIDVYAKKVAETKSFAALMGAAGAVTNNEMLECVNDLYPEFKRNNIAQQIAARCKYLQKLKKAGVDGED